MSNVNAVNLYRRACGDITLDDFLRCPHKTTTGIFYTPACCCFGVLEPGQDFQVVDGERFHRQAVFEARLFNKNEEWRWLRDPTDASGKGRGVGLREQSLGADWKPVETPLTPLDQYYLLWGEPLPEADAPPGWQWLSSARIGKLAVPRDGGRRLRLRSREYLGLAPGEAGEHGNVVVLEERLVDIEAFPEGD